MEYEIIDLPQSGTQAAKEKLNSMAKEGWRLVTALHIPDRALYNPREADFDDIYLEHQVRYVMARPLKPDENTNNWAEV